MRDLSAMAIAIRVSQADFLDQPTIAGYDRAENLALRVLWALEAAGYLEDHAGDRTPDGICELGGCNTARREPHADHCGMPRCVTTGNQRLVCRQAGKAGHDCGRSLWAVNDS